MAENTSHDASQEEANPTISIDGNPGDATLQRSVVEASRKPLTREDEMEDDESDESLSDEENPIPTGPTYGQSPTPPPNTPTPSPPRAINTTKRKLIALPIFLCCFAMGFYAGLHWNDDVAKSSEIASPNSLWKFGRTVVDENGIRGQETLTYDPLKEMYYKVVSMAPNKGFVQGDVHSSAYIRDPSA